MQQLNEAIAAVLREVQRGSAAAQEASRLALLPERVRLTLNFSLDAGRPPCAQAEGPHSVTLEFIVGTAGDWKSMPLPDGDISSVPSVTEENKLVPALARVFGEPGFDSSARATVFRETLEGMSDAQAQAVIKAFSLQRKMFGFFSLRNDTTSCGIKLVLSSGTAYSYYSVSVGSPSQGDFSLLTDRRGTISGSFTVLKSILTAGSTTFYLFINGAAYSDPGVAVPSATIKVTNRCPA